MSPELTSHAIGNPSVNFVSFTGSVAGGRSVAKAAAEAKGFTGVALEVCINRILRYNLINLNSLAEKTPRTLGWMRISNIQLQNSSMVHIIKFPIERRVITYFPAL